MLESRWHPFLPVFVAFLTHRGFCTIHLGWSNRFCHALLNCFLSAEGAYTFLHVSMAVCSAPLLKFFFFFNQTRNRNVSVSHHNFKIWKTCVQMCVYAQVCGIVPAQMFNFLSWFSFFIPAHYQFAADLSLLGANAQMFGRFPPQWDFVWNLQR